MPAMGRGGIVGSGPIMRADRAGTILGPVPPSHPCPDLGDLALLGVRRPVADATSRRRAIRVLPPCKRPGHLDRRLPLSAMAKVASSPSGAPAASTSPPAPPKSTSLP